MSKQLISSVLWLVAVAALVHAQSQSGFISIDCGFSEKTGYTDKITGLNYASDATFIDTGVSHKLPSVYNNLNLTQQFLNVRSFPRGTRNCYTLNSARGSSKFLIRARFMYGNYDGKGKPPRFDLLLEADVWDSVEFGDESTIVTKEIVHVPQNKHIYVCLVNKGSGTPFISALELRPLVNRTYTAESGSLSLIRRWDVGSIATEAIRYPEDAYDRIWLPNILQNSEPISTPGNISITIDYQLPSTVLQTAAIPTNGSSFLRFSWEPTDLNHLYYAFLYFSEFENLEANNQTREIMIYENGTLWFGPFSLLQLESDMIRSSKPLLTTEKMEFIITTTEDSTLPPTLSALEIYRFQEFQQLLTNQEDVEAIVNIKSKYGVKRNWQGDPCVPKVYLWQGLNCSYPESDPPKITSLNLSSSGITGEIDSYISSLKSIQILDLSNNNLTGTIPDFLLLLPFLRELNLNGNKLEGSVPVGLIEKQKNGLLSLSVQGNPDLCSDASCTLQDDNNRNKFIVPVVATIVPLCVLLTAIAILLSLKIRKAGKKNDVSSLKLKNRKFSYSDLLRITNNLERVLGKGGFGTVYYGCLDDTQVAVKMLSPSSAQGYKQFQAEVELLLRVHHKNLTTLVGYCDEGKNMGLIYEFMANGNLQTNLLEDQADTLSWEARLRIAAEAAQGLEYLHSGCKPPILHRDVKSTNILLNEKFQAKLSDFGLSRTFQVEAGTHITTAIAGTPGYVDPEYQTSSRLTEKSDVYSFGVVLLEIITSKQVIEGSNERTHITQWVSFILGKGDIENIVDPRLQGDFDINSVWKAVETAMSCVSPTSTKRPNMTQVVMDLNECLAIEIARTKAAAKENPSRASIKSISLTNPQTELFPLAR